MQSSLSLLSFLAVTSLSNPPSPLFPPSWPLSFMRFPGGCYIEGDWMRNAFRWKAALGHNEQRPGHMNGEGGGGGGEGWEAWTLREGQERGGRHDRWDECLPCCVLHVGSVRGCRCSRAAKGINQATSAATEGMVELSHP